MSRLVLILGDQLSLDIASLRAADKASDIIVMGELADEAGYAWHHSKKLALIFSAMRHFAQTLRDAGWRVRYQQLDDPDAAPDFSTLLERALAQEICEEILLVEPGEWRLKQMFDGWANRFGKPVSILEDDRFLCSHEAFSHWADGRKSLVMEWFYREMRKTTGLLMEGDQPVGGKWNFDAENRKPLKDRLFLPRPPRFEPDEITRGVLDMIEARFPDQFGQLRPFWFAVTREDALAVLDAFIEEALARFGDYQDAMVEGEAFLYHSLLSPLINIGLLSPLEVCERVAAAYEAGDAPINAAEGFIRQIIGWREYVRGIYWREGPDYVRRNALNARRKLPAFYWTGKTDMACMRAAIGQTIHHAYAHHIQRLMVTGNFALIAGIDPFAVHEWYLAVYADAFEWVEAPNTVGMALYADSGALGSKPYAASGAYINRMSDYCAGCRYKVSKRDAEDACPFNALYWNFMIRNRDQLGANQRLRRVYANWDRMSQDDRAACLKRAKEVLGSLDSGERI